MDFNKIKTRITMNELVLSGYSRGGFKTGLFVSPLQICLDAGISFPNHEEPNLILITHGHNDHVGELNNILIGNSRKDKIPIISTSNIIDLIGNYLNSIASLNCGYIIEYNKWIPSKIVDKYRVKIQNKNIEFQLYKMDHTVECIGFGVSEIRNRLKSEFLNKSREELINFKKTNEITEEKEVPLFLFCGDTGNSILNNLPFNKYPFVIIESTFFHVDHILDAKEKKHIHIFDLEPYFIKYKETKFILIHFSCRYTIQEIKNYQKEYQEKYENIIFFI